MLIAFKYAQVSLLHVSPLDLVQPKNHIYPNSIILGVFFFPTIPVFFSGDVVLASFLYPNRGDSAAHFF